MTKKILLFFAICLGLGICGASFIHKISTSDIPVTAPQTKTHSKSSHPDSKAIGWGFKKIKGSEPEIGDSVKEQFSKYNAFYMDTKKTKSLYLTFDEGYENGFTGKILDVLKTTNTPAAFFITGPYLKNEKELVDRMVAEGHIVGNHTVNHPNLAKCDSEKAKQEICELNSAFYEVYGKNMEYLRPPEGEYSEKLLALASELGYKTIFWSFAYKDWDVNNQRGADFAFSSVTPYLHDGAIILLHAVSEDNANALERIINFAKEQGYEFKSLDEL